MRVDAVQLGYIGAREEQQDSAGIFEVSSQDGHLFVLADGLGGHKSGDVASRIAVDCFAERVEQYGSSSRQVDRQVLLDTLNDANERISNYTKQHPEAQGMGTTLVACLLEKDTLQWISVGDSHLYLFRDGVVTKLNEDHSQAGQLVKAGEYAPDDPELDQYRHLLRSALMGDAIDLIDAPEHNFPLKPRDILVLASDGLDTLSSNQLSQTLSSFERESAGHIAESLISEVEGAGDASQDNTMLVVAKLLPMDTAASKPPDRVETDRKAGGGIWAFGLAALILGGLALAAYAYWQSGSSGTPSPNKSPHSYEPRYHHKDM